VALRQCGSDFTLIQKLFPTRSRKQIRNKFKKEERLHPKLVDYAFKHPLPFDLDAFRRPGVHLPTLRDDLDGSDHGDGEGEEEGEEAVDL